ncbi:MAG: hypothetical protein MUC94_04435 [bacterium]|jgi:hypothetical protein|nr:hypothetical protein [bacterium]
MFKINPKIKQADNLIKGTKPVIELVNNLPGSKSPYALLPSEPTLIFNIIIPKKIKFQGILHDTLIEGFNLEEVKSHFCDKNNKAVIEDFLRKYDSFKSYNETTIHKFPAVHYGHSISEVDGAFLGNNGHIYDERTQIVNLIFIPNLDEMVQKYPNKERYITEIKREIFNNNFNILGYERTDDVDDIRHEVIELIREWVFYVRLFVFGYICFKICQYINELGKMSGKIEEEVWVTSSWATHLNRIIFDPIKEG